MTTYLHPLPLLLVLAFVVPNAAFAQPVEYKLTASDTSPDDHFGYAVAASGDVVVVGAYQDDGSGNDSGAAYVYRYAGGAWVEEQKLTASDGDGFDWFGFSVAVSGDVIVVGAYQDEDGGSARGSAYVFRYDGGAWVEEQKLSASDGAASDHFGYAVAASGEVVVVGADGDDDGGSMSGSAYVFRYDEGAWAEEQKLTASDGAAFDFFGQSVAVAGGVVVVGAEQDDDDGTASGSAYVYRYTGGVWVEEQKLTGSDGDDLDFFGQAVAVSDDVIVVGAGGDENGPSETGSAYVFRYEGGAWAEEQKLTASDGAPSDFFGQSVGVDGEAVVVGALFNDNLNGEDSGAAYVYRYDGGAWAEERKLTASDGADLDWFGRSVAVAEGMIIVGADGDDDGGPQSGSAYAYVDPAPTSTEEAPQALPSHIHLAPPSPNPSHGAAVLRYTLERPAQAQIQVVDAYGRRVLVYPLGALPAGTSEATLDLSALPSGVYLLRLETKHGAAVQQITLLR